MENRSKALIFVAVVLSLLGYACNANDMSVPDALAAPLQQGMVDEKSCAYQCTSCGSFWYRVTRGAAGWTDCSPSYSCFESCGKSYVGSVDECREWLRSRGNGCSCCCPNECAVGSAETLVFCTWCAIVAVPCGVCCSVCVAVSGLCSVICGDMEYASTPREGRLLEV